MMVEENIGTIQISELIRIAWPSKKQLNWEESILFLTYKEIFYMVEIMCY